MNTFFNILQSLIGISNKRYPSDPFVIPENFENNIYFGEKGHIICLINSIFYKAKDSKKTNMFSKNAEAKFSSLNAILENTFYQNELKERIFGYSCIVLGIETYFLVVYLYLLKFKFNSGSTNHPHSVVNSGSSDSTKFIKNFLLDIIVV